MPSANLISLDFVNMMAKPFRVLENMLEASPQLRSKKIFYLKLPVFGCISNAECIMTVSCSSVSSSVAIALFKSKSEDKNHSQNGIYFLFLKNYIDRCDDKSATPVSTIKNHTDSHKSPCVGGCVCVCPVSTVHVHFATMYSTHRFAAVQSSATLNDFSVCTGKYNQIHTLNLYMLWFSSLTQSHTARVRTTFTAY